MEDPYRSTALRSKRRSRVAALRDQESVAEIARRYKVLTPTWSTSGSGSCGQRRAIVRNGPAMDARRTERTCCQEERELTVERDFLSNHSGDPDDVSPTSRPMAPSGTLSTRLSASRWPCPGRACTTSRVAPDALEELALMRRID